MNASSPPNKRNFFQQSTMEWEIDSPNLLCTLRLLDEKIFREWSRYTYIFLFFFYPLSLGLKQKLKAVLLEDEGNEATNAAKRFRKYKLLSENWPTLGFLSIT